MLYTFMNLLNKYMNVLSMQILNIKPNVLYSNNKGLKIKYMKCN